MSHTLISVIKEIAKYKDLKDVTLVSLAHGPVILISCENDSILVKNSLKEETYCFDNMGRLFETGTCLLYPPREFKTWTEFKKACVDDYYNSFLRSGDVCLVKKDDMSEWSLAIYQGKWDQGFSAKQGKDPETFKFCIPYTKNEGMLGRVLFPDWMLDDDN